MDDTNLDRPEDTEDTTDLPESKSSPWEPHSEGGVEMGLGQPGPTDEEADTDGNGEEPFRNTPVTPNANR